MRIKRKQVKRDWRGGGGGFDQLILLARIFSRFFPCLDSCILLFRPLFFVFLFLNFFLISFLVSLLRFFVLIFKSYFLNSHFCLPFYFYFFFECSGFVFLSRSFESFFFPSPDWLCTFLSIFFCIFVYFFTYPFACLSFSIFFCFFFRSFANLCIISCYFPFLFPICWL